jgi:hypothetical protein
VFTLEDINIDITIRVAGCTVGIGKRIGVLLGVDDALVCRGVSIFANLFAEP